MTGGNHVAAGVVPPGMRLRLALVLILAGLNVLAACGDDDGGGTAPSGVLTPQGALDVDGSPVLEVSGFLHIDDTGPKMCSDILESFPPQCGGATLFLVDLDPGTVSNLQEEQGISWAEGYLAQLQRVEGSTFRVVLR
ncbi:MAG: hypothetical protein AAGA17_18005 [Actinomycetota bacterium]